MSARKLRAARLRNSKAGAPGRAAKPHSGNAASTAIKTAEHRWTFLTNHAHVLIVLWQTDDLVLREVASRVGITERAVQRIVADLEEDGFLERERIGRHNRYRIRSERPLRHPIESHRTIGDLISILQDD